MTIKYRATHMPRCVRDLCGIDCDQQNDPFGSFCVTSC